MWDQVHRPWYSVENQRYMNRSTGGEMMHKHMECAFECVDSFIRDGAKYHQIPQK